MDPYLERYWHEVHPGLIVYARDQLQPLLPAGLRCAVEERVFVEPDEGDLRTIIPDVHVSERRQSTGAGPVVGGHAAVAEPLVLELESESVTQGYLEIVDARSGNRVITVIEFLSPSNKTAGEGQDLYLRKRQDATRAGANFVEIDLTRTGRRILSVPPERIPASHRTTYQACVRRAEAPRRVEVYRIPLREPLPTLPVPLRSTDADVPLNLQSLFNRCYQNGGYDELDYRAELTPPLEDEDARWAANLLVTAGVR
jgi:hypothetical protein